ncbi:MAG: hypothetical protein II404_01240 [Prevotella sp.]|nr:hypothetical protein [Prevotella sp.]
MNLKLRILTVLLGMMTFVPGFCYTQDVDSTTILSRIWNYQRNYTLPVDGLEQNVYLRLGFGTERRNFTLFLVPTMYVIAKGDRQYISESYCKVKFHDVNNYELHRQIVCGNIPRQRTAMPALLQSITPNLYDVNIYPEHLLSPFHRANRRYYRYNISVAEGGLSMVHFRPRSKNTQLVSGYAIVDNVTGRLQSVQFEGEFDMMAFKVTALMNKQDLHTPLPERCSTEATFRFLGNRITSHCTAVYNCLTTLPDTLDRKQDRKLMEELRPIPLSPKDQKIYDDFDAEQRKREAEEKADTTFVEENYDWVKEIGWDLIGCNLINGNEAEAGPLKMNFSPLFNPLYFGYSPSRGLSYRLRLGVQYSWNAHRYLTLNPQLGYNFKLKQFFFTIPLRMNYNPKRNGYAEIEWVKGNRTSNGILEQDFHRVMGDSIDMPEYQDMSIRAVNNVAAFDWLEIMTGIVYHRRQSLDSKMMEQAGIEPYYHSFAPLLTVRLTPWYNGPTLTANYERGLRNVFKSNLDYERWEFDASYLYRMKSMRILNMRAGTGFYTQRNSNYFVDFENFRTNNLPSGWEDDWSGEFQLLDGRWYNESNYYIRGHISYDSPLLVLYRLPLIGRYIETERIYLSALSIEHTRPYFEVGYGFTNRYLSAAIFASMLNGKVQRVGCKFTVELFSRW